MSSVQVFSGSFPHISRTFDIVSGHVLDSFRRPLKLIGNVLEIPRKCSANISFLACHERSMDVRDPKIGTDTLGPGEANVATVPKSNKKMYRK